MNEWSPIGVGGIGGSGTRVVAQILSGAGVHIGFDLNPSLDNLSFGLLFANPNVRWISESEFQTRVGIFCTAMSGSRCLDNRQKALIRALATDDWQMFETAWYIERAERLIAAANSETSHPIWGWKAPHTHIVLDRIYDTMPGVKYVHIMRNGFDMAFSQNQNQLKRFGHWILGEPFEISPRFSLKFWRKCHERVFRAAKKMASRFLLIRFEDLCSNPELEVRKIVEFCELSVDEDILFELAKSVIPPSSIGRHKENAYNDFAAEDVDFVGKYYQTTT